MALTFHSSSLRRVSRLLSVLAILSASVTAGYLLLPQPFADAFFAGWVLFSVLLSLVGGIGAWTTRSSLVWVAALLLVGLSIVGMWSIGLFIAPAALFLLGAALLLQLSGPSTDVREAIRSNPPPVREVMLKVLKGTIAVAAGVVLVYVGAFRQELFGACGTETVNCAIEKTHWDAVGLTVLGLVAVGLGGWFIWTEVYTVRAHTAKLIE